MKIAKQYDYIEGVLQPGENAFLFGYEKSFSKIQNMFHKNHLPQALILEGPKGIGKATFALHIAANILGKKQDFLPVSANDLLWKQIIYQNHGNFLHIFPFFDDKKKSNQSIGVQDIKKIHNFLEKTPQDPKNKRIVLIDSLDNTTFQAKNSFLKILEEPPRNVFFIIIASDKSQILPTIKSRCQILRCLELSNENMTKALGKIFENPFSFDAEKFQNILKLAKGNVRDAAFLVEESRFLLFQKIEEFLNDSILNYQILENISSVLSNKKNYVQFQQFLKYILTRISKNAKDNVKNDFGQYWANFYFDIQKKIIEAEIYNLDKKSLVHLILSLVHRLLYRL